MKGRYKKITVTVDLFLNLFVQTGKPITHKVINLGIPEDYNCIMTWVNGNNIHFIIESNTFDEICVNSWVRVPTLKPDFRILNWNFCDDFMETISQNNCKVSISTIMPSGECKTFVRNFHNSDTDDKFWNILEDTVDSHEKGQ